jgi:hypothetical protein
MRHRLLQPLLLLLLLLLLVLPLLRTRWRIARLTMQQAARLNVHGARAPRPLTAPTAWCWFTREGSAARA